MALNIGKEITALKRMTVPELRRKYAQVFGENTTSRHKEYLIRRIVWRLQVNQDGGLSERAKRRARDLATESDVRLTAPRPRPVDQADEMAAAPIEFPHAWLTIKRHPAQPDEEARLQKRITTADVPGTGQVVTAGGPDVDGDLRFDLTPDDTVSLGTRRLVHDIQLRLTTGKIYTIEKGTIQLVADVTKTTA
jgi:hypothetical protein